MKTPVDIPVAPYRVLEAIWYADQIPTLNESAFHYPYLPQMEVPLGEKSAKKALRKMTGTRLEFTVETPDGHSASIEVQAIPIRKNVSRLTWSMPSGNLNGSTDHVRHWMDSRLTQISSHFGS
ncbi:MAG: hypothetical protein HUU10_00915 [Bacteroidetes bacterium]|nr:hypothetical protein [Bacteroidota bacterium]